MTYCQTCDIRHSKSQNLNDSHLVLQLSLNEDAVGAATAGDAPTTLEWSTNLFPTQVPFILEILQQVTFNSWFDLKPMIVYDIKTKQKW